MQKFKQLYLLNIWQLPTTCFIFSLYFFAFNNVPLSNEIVINCFYIPTLIIFSIFFTYELFKNKCLEKTKLLKIKSFFIKISIILVNLFIPFLIIYLTNFSGNFFKLFILTLNFILLTSISTVLFNNILLIFIGPVILLNFFIFYSYVIGIKFTTIFKNFFLISIFFNTYNNFSIFSLIIPIILTAISLLIYTYQFKIYNFYTFILTFGLTFLLFIPDIHLSILLIFGILLIILFILSPKNIFKNCIIPFITIFILILISTLIYDNDILNIKNFKPKNIKNVSIETNYTYLQNLNNISYDKENEKYINIINNILQNNEYTPYDDIIFNITLNNGYISQIYIPIKDINSEDLFKLKNYIFTDALYSNNIQNSFLSNDVTTIKLNKKDTLNLLSTFSEEYGTDFEVFNKKSSYKLEINDKIIIIPIDNLFKKTNKLIQNFIFKGVLNE